MSSACGNVPLQIPSAAMCRFKFRLWKCLSYPQGSETAVTESHCKFRLWNCLRLARLALTAGIKTCMVLIVQIYMSILPFTREQQIVFYFVLVIIKTKRQRRPALPLMFINILQLRLFAGGKACSFQSL